MNLMNFINLKRILTYLTLILIIGLGFYFRYKGITDNHSFWADEAFISSYARDITANPTSFFETVGKISYEALHITITSISFKLMGVSEFGARFPVVIFGTAGIFAAYAAAAALSNAGGGLLAAFLYAFSQLNLSNSTQAKPYAVIETLFLIILYLIIRLKTEKKRRFHPYIHGLIIICILFASLTHVSAWLFLIPYATYIVFSYKPKKLIIASLPILCVVALLTLMYQTIIVAYIAGKWYNNTVLLKNLLLRQYGIFLLPALASLVFLIKKMKGFSLGLFFYMIVLLFMWNFKQYSHNIRYLVPLFGMIFVLFGVFWGRAGEWIAKKTKISSFMYLPILITVLLYISGYKIVQKPLAYYSPNADFYGDVQTANYKDMYERIRKKFPDYQNIAIFNDLIDAQRWYMPEKKNNAYFMKGIDKPQKHPVEGGVIYGTLADFLREQAKYPKGILIVEDWESFLPEEIKEYAKKNMRREFRVESLPYAKNDPWPLEVYSWGMD